jgi:tRNA threonylcarbamoyladenosine biosynthesis protein TsaB
MDGVLILALETATGCGSVSLTRDERLLAEVTHLPERVHSRRLLGTVSWLMEAAGVSWADLHGIGIDLGPGSFTGLRIGLAAAKGLALAADLPLLGVNSLDALTLACMGFDGQLCPVLDARKQEVYTAFYEAAPSGLFPRRLCPARAIRPEELVRQIERPTLVAGPAVTIYGDLFRANSHIRLLPAPLAHPRALYVGLRARQLYLDNTILDPALAVPEYVRQSEAEISLAEKKRNRQ